MTNEAKKDVYDSIINNAKATATGRMNAVISPSMLNVDPAYQRIEGRNIKKLNVLRNKWDYNKMDALIVVPHPETYDFYVVDGLGRLTVAKEKGITKLDCVIVNGPKDVEERRRFEAEYFVTQADGTDPIKPVLKHKALVLTGDKTATIINNVCNENNVEIRYGTGRRKSNELGSYAATKYIVQRVGENGLRYVFETIKEAGFNNERDGYAGGMMEALAKIYDGYNFVSAKELGKFLKPMNPTTFKARAIARYPERCAHSGMIAMVLYIQDWIVEYFGEHPVFDENGRKILVMKTA